VIGHGPVGRTLVKLLRDHGLEPTVVELNHETVARLRADGTRAIYGDATQREILEQAGVRDAGSLVFAASGSPEAVVRAAKELNPNLTTLTRATYLADAAASAHAGADVVVTAEIEVALAMAERLLAQLGATGEQLDNARQRVRDELVPQRRG
jgi:CPA2 family monovalent cation:H+ antiporter-2